MDMWHNLDVDIIDHEAVVLEVIWFEPYVVVRRIIFAYVDSEGVRGFKEVKFY